MNNKNTSNTLASTMKITGCTNKLYKLAALQTKQKHTDESPTIQFFPGNFFPYSLKKDKVNTGIELQILAYNGN